MTRPPFCVSVNHPDDALPDCGIAQYEFDYVSNGIDLRIDDNDIGILFGDVYLSFL
jgi:hypothetical protein